MLVCPGCPWDCPGYPVCLSGLWSGLSVGLSGLSCLFVRAVRGVVRAILFVCPGCGPGCLRACPGCRACLSGPSGLLSGLLSGCPVCLSGLSGLFPGLSSELSVGWSVVSCLFVRAVRAVCGVVRAVLFICPGCPGCCPGCPGCPGCGGSEVTPFWGVGSDTVSPQEPGKRPTSCQQTRPQACAEVTANSSSLPLGTVPSEMSHMLPAGAAHAIAPSSHGRCPRIGD